MLSLNAINLIWFLIFSLPIIFLYFLRFLNRKQPVSSNYLWMKLINKNQGFISLRKWSILLLIIQILAVFFGILVLTNAVLKIKKMENNGIVFLLDISASMNVEENDKNLRIDIAKDKIIEKIQEIKKLKDKKSAAIFLCDSDAKLLLKPTKNYNKILFKLKSINAGQSTFNAEEVSRIIDNWLKKQQIKYEGYLVSDGIFRYDNKLEKVFNNYFKYFIVGKNQENIGVTGLRITNDKKVNFSIINNYNIQKNINVTLTYNEKEINKFDLIAPIGISYYSRALNEVNFGRYKISIDNIEDYFLDNECFFVLNNPYKIKILIIGVENIFIDSIFSNNNLFDVIKIEKFEDLKNNENEFDLIINNNKIIPIDLRNNILSFGFIPENNIIKKGIKIKGELVKTSSLHPLLRYIDFDAINIYDAVSIKNDNLLLGLFYIDNYPVSVLFMDRGYSKIIFGFELDNSNFVNYDVFPIFINNFFKWKIPQWENPLAYNLNPGREHLIYYNKKFRNIENQDIIIKKAGPYLKINPVKTGFYNIKLDNEIINISSNLELSELDIAPRDLPYSKSNNIETLNYTVKKFPLTQIFIIIFILFLLLEWFLWNTNLIAGRKE